MGQTDNPESPRRLGDFEIVREIGRGGMGVVYEARQVSLDRPVALKVLSGGLSLTPKAVQRFHREAAAARHGEPLSDVCDAHSHALHACHRLFYEPGGYHFRDHFGAVECDCLVRGLRAGRRRGGRGGDVVVSWLIRGAVDQLVRLFPRPDKYLAPTFPPGYLGGAGRGISASDRAVGSRAVEKGNRSASTYGSTFLFRFPSRGLTPGKT
jgi:hypothetical protein